MTKLKVSVYVLALVTLMCGSLAAQGPPEKPPIGPVKWSQYVDVDNGWDVYSFWEAGSASPRAVAADDWKCPNGLPVTDVHWWGSYIGGEPDPTHPGAEAFEISIHGNIPAGQELGHASHPDPNALFYLIAAPVGIPGGVQENFFDVGGGTRDPHDIYQYNYTLPAPFPQEEGVIYWMNIVAILPDNGLTWGWHTGLRPPFIPDDGLDAAVNIYDYQPNGWYSEWGSLYDQQGPVQLAFELTTVPEPATLTVVGTAGVLLAGLVRRKRMSSRKDWKLGRSGSLKPT